MSHCKTRHSVFIVCACDTGLDSLDWKLPCLLFRGGRMEREGTES